MKKYASEIADIHCSDGNAITFVCLRRASKNNCRQHCNRYSHRSGNTGLSQAPAYVVLEIDVTNADLYKQCLDKNRPRTAEFGGRFLARAGTIGTWEPPKRAVIAAFDSIEKAQTFRDSPAYKELLPLRDRASKYRAFIVEGSAS